MPAPLVTVTGGYGISIATFLFDILSFTHCAYGPKRYYPKGHKCKRENNMPGMYEIGGADEIGAVEIYGADELGADELGADELYGDEYGDEYGAPQRRRAAPANRLAALQAQIRKLAAQNRALAAGAGRQTLPTGLKVRETAPTADRELTVNFASAAPVAAGALATVTSQPQVQVFRGERLMIPESSVGAFFVIEDIIVGKNSQLAGTGVGQSAVLFSEKAVGAGQRFDPCTLGMVITLKVRNIDVNPRAFLASLFGRAVFLPIATGDSGSTVTVTIGAKHMAGLLFSVDLLGWRSAPDAYTAAYIKPWLEALVQSNMIYLRENPSTPSILDPIAGVSYRRERDRNGNPTEVWRDIPRILRERNGDCEDLACALVAELRVKRRLPAKVIIKASRIRPGGRLFHILAGVGRERIDPSKILGMNGEG